MIRARGLKVAAAVLGLASVMLAGCVVAPAPGYYEGGPVMVAPPAPQVEVVGAAPGPGYLWVGGYWNWVGGRHVWVPGRWEAPAARLSHLGRASLGSLPRRLSAPARSLGALSVTSEHGAAVSRLRRRRHERSHERSGLQDFSV